MLIKLLQDAGLDHTQIEVMVTDTENTMGSSEKTSSLSSGNPTHANATA
jgi:hypothetical protein